MLVLKVQAKSHSYYRGIIARYRSVRMKYPLHVDIVRTKEYIYIFSLDDGFSAAFLCMAYFKARENNLDADLLYARYIDLESLPEDVRKMGGKWLQKRLSESEIINLKNISITEHILRRWFHDSA